MIKNKRKVYIHMGAIAVALAIMIIVGLTLVRGQDKKEAEPMNEQGKKWHETEAELRERLTDLQYRVTREDATEPPFHNKYWDNKEDGIYVDIVSGEPLFSSRDKYNSGTGWPSFTRPIHSENVQERLDRRYGTTRVEIRSTTADSHLGHVFKDGPPPTGLRYCINSAALRFIPREQLEAEGYGHYLHLFE